MDKTQTYRLIDTLNQDPDRCRAIETISFSLVKTSVGIFGSFSVCMAMKLPRIELLRLQWCEWVAGQLHAQVFVHITLAFGSVTMLHLNFATFPSALVFGRLVRALPCLSFLRCHHVSFERPYNVASIVQARRPVRLDTIHLMDSDDVVDFLVSSSTHLRHLSSYELNLSKCSELLPVTTESLSSMHIELERIGPREAFPIDFTPAVNLRILLLTAELEDMVRAANILSRASLPKLTEVTTTLTLYDARSYSSIVQDALDKIDKDQYARIDEVLSGRQYPALQKVAFDLVSYVPRSKVKDVISEVSWRSQLSSWFPALHASGRLVSSVSVRVYVGE
ncbi:uncharacterized protein FIBRA_02923 [Fibroporia radiculosa]|uniref:F-box domain-containing protein n=1 Tax=Fibroporia radiculosa TaxID=599839 RepID=J4HVP6_9APHY|nr:uncharacterized protein FIBRA_02923 [Fibroporia radiculosa]CCM00877.1 predicted protein [Fibroporia radiculosa]